MFATLVALALASAPPQSMLAAIGPGPSAGGGRYYLLDSSSKLWTVGPGVSDKNPVANRPPVPFFDAGSSLASVSMVGPSNEVLCLRPQYLDTAHHILKGFKITGWKASRSANGGWASWGALTPTEPCGPFANDSILAVMGTLENGAGPHYLVALKRNASDQIIGPYPVVVNDVSATPPARLSSTEAFVLTGRGLYYLKLQSNGSWQATNHGLPPSSIGLLHEIPQMYFIGAPIESRRSVFVITRMKKSMTNKVFQHYDDGSGQWKWRDMDSPTGHTPGFGLSDDAQAPPVRLEQDKALFTFGLPGSALLYELRLDSNGYTWTGHGFSPGGGVVGRVQSNGQSEAFVKSSNGTTDSYWIFYYLNGFKWKKVNAP